MVTPTTGDPVPTTRMFSLGVILTVTTDTFLMDDIGDLYELLNYMTRDELFTHQLPRAAKECRPALLAQHPQLTDITVPGDLSGADAFKAWLANQSATLGAELPVAQLDPAAHEHINPLVELTNMAPGKPIVVVVAP